MDERDEAFEELIERSSLGTPGARQLRRRTPRSQVDAVRRIVELRNQMVHSSGPESAAAAAALVQLLRELGYHGQAEDVLAEAFPGGESNIVVRAAEVLGETADPQPTEPAVLDLSTETPSRGSGTPVSAPAESADERPTLEQAYAHHHTALTEYTTQLAARFRLPDPHRDAEDIVQATFEDAMRNWSTVKNLAAWLHTVARRKVQKAAYEAARHRLATNEDFDRAENRGWTSVSLRPSAEDTVLARQVFDAIAALPDRQRTVIYLRHVEGWSVREIADLLGSPPRSPTPFSAGSAPDGSRSSSR